MRTKFKSKNWKREAADNPHLIPFLKQVIKDLHFSKILIRIGNYARATGSAQKINLVPVHPKIKGHDYTLIEEWLKKKGIEIKQWPDWQWMALHEFAHAVLDKKYQAKKKKYSANLYAGLFRPGMPLRRHKPHGKEFRYTLLRLAKKYPPIGGGE